MLKETKIGEVIIVTQTTYFVYLSAEDREKDNFHMCTSNKKEVDALKKRLRNKKKVFVAVIAPNLTEFMDWQHREMRFSRPGDTIRKITRGNTTYICITRPEDVCGNVFDKTIEIGSKRNKQYDKIMEYLKPAMNYGKK